MNTKYRTRKLVIQVSQDAYQALQDEAVRIDRHAYNVCSEIVENALMALKYNKDDALDELPEMEVES